MTTTDKRNPMPDVIKAIYDGVVTRLDNTGEPYIRLSSVIAEVEGMKKQPKGGAMYNTVGDEHYNAALDAVIEMLRGSDG